MEEIIKLQAYARNLGIEINEITVTKPSESKKYKIWVNLYKEWTDFWKLAMENQPMQETILWIKVNNIYQF